MTIGCYVINLDRSPERLEHFRLQAAREGVNFQRISAVDGRRLDKATMERLLSIGLGHRIPSPGELGCYLSHRKAWTRLLHDGFDSGFIAEDDAHLANASCFLSTSAWLPAQFDLIKADTMYHLCEFRVDEHSTYFGHTLRRPKGSHPGAVGYFVSRQGATRLLGATENLCEAIDEIMYNRRFGVAQSLITFQLDPAICVDDGFARHVKNNVRLKSTIGSRNFPVKSDRASQAFVKSLVKVFRPFAWFYYQFRRLIKTWMGASLFKRVRFAGDD